MTRALLALGLLLAAGPTVCSQRSQPAPRQAPQGLYLLIGTDKATRATWRAEPASAGLSLRARWKNLQPSRDRLRWSYFDGEIARARKAGKGVMLRVIPGAHSPGWLYEEGAERFSFRQSNRHREDRGKTRTMPVPWDPTFLEHWTRFVGLMGERYAAEPVVRAVHLVGPARQSGEMHLPKSPADRQRWRRVGYSREKLVGAWQRCIDAYAEAFPDTPLVINVSTTVFPEDGVVDTVLAYAKQRVGHRLCLQHNALHARTTSDFPTHRLVASNAGTVALGFQFVSPAANAERFRGTLAEAFAIGLDAGASYFEVYPADLKDPASRTAIEQTARRLAASVGAGASP